MYIHYILCQGLRVDGRRSRELRRIHCSMGVLTQADGSAKLEQGNTKVLATVYGPHDVRILISYFKYILIIIYWNRSVRNLKWFTTNVLSIANLVQQLLVPMRGRDDLKAIGKILDYLLYKQFMSYSCNKSSLKHHI